MASSTRGSGDRTGEIDELRISRIVCYQLAYEPARRFEPDLDTMLLLHFDEGEGAVADDASPYERDGVSTGGVTWVGEGEHGVCRETPGDPVQDVSARPIPITIGRGAFTLDGLSSVGWYFDIVETPIAGGRTHSEPDLVHYRDVTMRGIRGSTADVTWLAGWSRRV